MQNNMETTTHCTAKCDEIIEDFAHLMAQIEEAMAAEVEPEEYVPPLPATKAKHHGGWIMADVALSLSVGFAAGKWGWRGRK